MQECAKYTHQPQKPLLRISTNTERIIPCRQLFAVNDPFTLRRYVFLVVRRQQAENYMLFESNLATHWMACILTSLFETSCVRTIFSLPLVGRTYNHILHGIDVSFVRIRKRRAIKSTEDDVRQYFSSSSIACKLARIACSNISCVHCYKGRSKKIRKDKKITTLSRLIE